MSELFVAERSSLHHDVSPWFFFRLRHPLCVKKLRSVAKLACSSQRNSRELMAAPETTRALFLAEAQPLYPSMPP